MAAAVAARGGAVEGCFELSVGNPDKGMLPLPEVQRRVAQFVSAGLAVVITQVSCLLRSAQYSQRSRAFIYCSYMFVRRSALVVE